MANKPLDQWMRDEIYRRTKAGESWRPIAKDLGISPGTIGSYAYRPEKGGDKHARTFTEKGDAAELSFSTRKEIRTVQDVIDHSEVDTLTWEVERFICNSWPMGYVDKATGKGAQEPLYQVKVWFRRRMSKPLMDAAEAIYQRYAAVAPTKFPPAPKLKRARPAMAVYPLCDVHVGKLAWKPEAGVDNDLKITERRYRESIERLKYFTRGVEVERAVIGVGNDLVHIDNKAAQTTSGTPMNCDGRLGKIVTVAFDLMTWTIDDLLTRVDSVEVLHVPGNHDSNVSYFIARMLDERFRHCKRVHVDIDPISRKYVHWGCNLIGFTHGEGVSNPNNLPTIMATEKPEEWAKSTCREWHLGHEHTEKKFTTRDIQEKHGVVMRWNSALSGGDAWHHWKGFIGNRIATDAYLYDRELGKFGHFTGMAA